MKIFISGSANINTIPASISNMIDKSVEKYPDALFLVGDCRGTDAAIQNYLSKKNYNFNVYYSGNAPRNCSPTATAQININAKGKYGRDFYTQKDIQMTKDCDICIAIWDGKSKGTEANINRAIAENKTIIVYRTDNNKLYEHTPVT